MFKMVAVTVLWLFLSIKMGFGENDSSQIIILDRCAFRPVFVEDFSHFHVSSWRFDGRGWTAHTPWAGDFGDAAFSDPRPGFPFTTDSRGLQIEARKQSDGKWRSGLIASADGEGHGFAQTYGYFEMQAQLPTGDGLWPAFWLATSQPRMVKDTGIEIDVMEHYGRFPNDFHSAVHVWNQPPIANKATEHVTNVYSGSLYAALHTYGVNVDINFIEFYFDRRKIWQIETPVEHSKPLLILVDLALGAGWPINNTPSPSTMRVAYVKAFKKIDSECKL